MSDKLREALESAESALAKCDKHFKHGAGYVCDALSIVRAALRDDDGWVSVKERPPKALESVIAWGRFDKGDDYCAGEAFAKDGKWYSVRAHCDYVNVTHWRHLPEPPKEDK